MDRAPARNLHLVVAVGLALVVVHLGFRAWAIAGGWFYGDDLELNRVAITQPFGWDYLTAVHSGHLMPIGRALVKLSVIGGSMNWPLTTALIVLLQAAAWLTGFWALLVLFGRRWATVALLAVYLASAITLPATVWWSAALNQLPHQAGLWLSLGAWVNYERGRGWRWLVLTMSGVGVALLTDIRGVFLLPVLALVSFGWFSRGSTRERLRFVLARHWRLLVAILPALLGYAAFYTTHSDDVTTRPTARLAGSLAQAMGDSFMVGMLGGPWRWTNPFPPTPYAASPDWAVHLSWVAVAVVLLHVHLTRSRALRAFTLTGVYVVMLYVVLLTSRAPLVGALIGAEYRYLTDVAAMAVVSLGLAYLQLAGATESSAPRVQPLFTGRTPRWLPVGVAGLVVVSGTVSSIGYIRPWHETKRAGEYVANLQTQLDRLHPIDLAATKVPEDVISPLIWREEALPNLVSLLQFGATFPEATGHLGVVDDSGHIRAGLVEQGVVSKPGPLDGCGWKVTDVGRTIALTGRAFEYPWWMRIGYLAQHESAVLIQAGNSTVSTKLEGGLHSLYVRNDGGFDEVTVRGLDPGVTVCVDSIEVGKVVPGGEFR